MSLFCCQFFYKKPPLGRGGNGAGIYPIKGATDAWPLTTRAFVDTVVGAFEGCLKVDAAFVGTTHVSDSKDPGECVREFARNSLLELVCWKFEFGVVNEKSSFDFKHLFDEPHDRGLQTTGTVTLAIGGVVVFHELSD